MDAISKIIKTTQCGPKNSRCRLGQRLVNKTSYQWRGNYKIQDRLFKPSYIKISYIVGLFKHKTLNKPIKKIDIAFLKGWDGDGLLEEINNRENIDIKAKTTTKGPHKADIQFLYKNTEAKHILSRGEQKLLSIIWTYSQHKTIKDMFNKEPVLILDDIKSELDSHTFEVFLSLLELIETQVIFSCIEDIISSKIEDKFKGLKKFHVEQFKT